MSRQSITNPSEPAMVFARIDLTGESLAELLDALEVSAEELERAAIRAIQASFVKQPAAALLSAPTEIVTAPAPPAEQWIRSPKPRFTALAPETSGSATFDSRSPGASARRSQPSSTAS